MTKGVEFDIIAKLFERDGNKKGNLEKSLKNLKIGVDKIKELMYNSSCTRRKRQVRRTLKIKQRE